MYCSRTDIEAKRLPRQNLIQLTDDEMRGEWDDGVAPPPAENTAWLLSDANSNINVRVKEAIEDAVNEIHFWISKRYAVPLEIPLPIPEQHPFAVINSICVSLAVYYLFMRRNAVEVQNNIIDTALLGYKQAIEKLKLIADGKIKLDAPSLSTESGLSSARTLVSAPKPVFQNLKL